MRVIEKLNELNLSHGLDKMVRNGIIPISIIIKREIYNEYDVFIRMGKKTVEAVNLTSDKLNISVREIYRAKTIMEGEFE